MIDSVAIDVSSVGNSAIVDVVVVFCTYDDGGGDGDNDNDVDGVGDEDVNGRGDNDTRGNVEVDDDDEDVDDQAALDDAVLAIEDENVVVVVVGVAINDEVDCDTAEVEVVGGRVRDVAELGESVAVVDDAFKS